MIKQHLRLHDIILFQIPVAQPYPANQQWPHAPPVQPQMHMTQPPAYSAPPPVYSDNVNLVVNQSSMGSY